MMNKSFDVIVFGATGFTGQLVAEYLQSHYGSSSSLRWAMAGRKLSKLAAVRDAIGAPADLPLIVADASDPTALQGVAKQTKVVLTTVGPYQLHGEPLLAACVAAGTDYVDLCGEPGWMAQMIAKYDMAAKASGARIVFSCGFDSIPFDLGVVFLQAESMRRFGVPCKTVHGRVRRLKGTASGGTVASLLATVEAMGRDPTLAAVMANPFALTPGFTGPPQPAGDAAIHDELAQAWAGPFVMAMINTKNVHRTNALLGHAFGTDFVYDEMMLTGKGRSGELRARGLARNNRWQNLALGFAPARALLRRFVLPKPGEGPSKEARENGFYDLQFIGQTADGKTLRASVKGDRDPGYGSTSKMIAQAALCLAEDLWGDQMTGGVWTPGAAMGLVLIERLRAHAGLQFAIDDEAP